MNESEQQSIINKVRFTLASRGTPLPDGVISIDHFGDSPRLSADLLALIASGKK
jgi:hypothetical protein